MRAQVVTTIPGLREQRIAGSIWYREREGSVWGIAFVCPCGCGNESYLPIDRQGHPGPSWDWDGDRERPTLTPSVFNTGMPCQWHGWLTGGDWISC